MRSQATVVTFLLGFGPSSDGGARNGYEPCFSGNLPEELREYQDNCHNKNGFGKRKTTLPWARKGGATSKAEGAISASVPIDIVVRAAGHRYSQLQITGTHCPQRAPCAQVVRDIFQSEYFADSLHCNRSSPRGAFVKRRC